MSNDGQPSLLKFISSFGSKGNKREFVDYSTQRSRPQQRLPRKKKTTGSTSYSVSPSTKRKLRTTECPQYLSPAEKKWKSSKMSQPAKKDASTEIDQSEKKHPPELQALKDDIMGDMHKLIGPIKESIDALLQIKDAWETGVQKCQRVLATNNELRARITKVESENAALSQRVASLEDKMLAGNVMFQGIPDSLWEPSDTTKQKVLTAISFTISGKDQEDKMEQAKRIPIKDVQRVGRYAAMRTRPVLVEFYHKSDAEFLLSNRAHLPQGVFVDKQYSEETEKKRRRLRPILRAARNHKDYKGKCKMEGSKLVIKSRNYDRSNLHQLPAKINGFRATSKTDGDTLGFFGELNPLSNFHLAPFTINGEQYHSSEQFIQHQKSRLFGDKQAEMDILAATTPIECKTIAKDIKNYDAATWKNQAKATCTPGILAKLKQHQSLTNLLISTGEQKLAECCRDKDWGTGIALHDPKALDRTQWHSQGLLGEILETIRSILKGGNDTSPSAMDTAQNPT